MAEAAGLAIGAIALASLASDCIECFDIIELTKTYSRDLEILETSLEAQKLRLIIWLQANGLAGPIPYNTTLDDPLIRGSIDRALQCIKRLFEDSDALRRKYGLQAINSNSVSRSTASGPRIPVFNETYRQFRARLQNIQRSTNIARKTKWAIQDRNKFKGLVEDLKSMTDVVENITQSAEQLQRRRELIAVEVDSIMDEERLQLVQEVASLNSDGDLSSAASRRIKLLAGPIASKRNSVIGTINNTVTSQESFRSAHSYIVSADSDKVPPGKDDEDQDHPRQTSLLQPAYLNPSHARPPDREFNFKDRESNSRVSRQELISRVRARRNGTSSVTQSDYVPLELNFLIEPTPVVNHWHKRMLREIDKSQEDLPLVGFTPIQANDFSHLLGHFLGPKDTPYEGGIFYVRICIPKDYPWKAPICQLLTRVYHPNIDANGRICLDLLYDQWGAGLSINYILLCISTLLGNPDTADALVPEIAATYSRDRAEYDNVARLYTTKYATGDKPVLPLASESDEARPWWQNAQISV